VRSDVNAKRAIPIPTIIENIPASKIAPLEFLFNKYEIEYSPE